MAGPFLLCCALAVPPAVPLGRSADGARLLCVQAARAGRTVLVVSDTRGGKILRAFRWDEPGRFSADLSPDGRTVAAASWQNHVCFFDVPTGKARPFRFPPPWTSPTCPSACVRFAPSGSRLVLAGVDGRLRVLSVPDGRLLAEIQETNYSLGGVGPFVAEAALSPDGRTLAAEKSMNMLSVWEVATGQLVRHYAGDRLLFAPDNRRLAVRRSGAYLVYDLHSGELLREYPRGGPAFAWDAVPPARAAKPQPPDGPHRERPGNDQERLWNDLARRDGGPGVEKWKEQAGIDWKDIEDGKSARAYGAIARLAADPERALPLLRRRLGVRPRPEARRLDALLADLGSDRFARREAASRELAGLGLAAAPALRAALGRPLPLEIRRRVEKLLRAVDDRLRGPEYARALQVLERIGTPDAQALQRYLAEAAGARAEERP